MYWGKNHVDLARDFTYNHDIVKGYVGFLDTTGKSTKFDSIKASPTLCQIFNFGSISPVTARTLVSIQG